MDRGTVFLVYISTVLLFEHYIGRLLVDLDSECPQFCFGDLVVGEEFVGIKDAVDQLACLCNSNGLSNSVILVLGLLILPRKLQEVIHIRQKWMSVGARRDPGRLFNCKVTAEG